MKTGRHGNRAELDGKLNRPTEKESREHTDLVHNRERDNWSQVKQGGPEKS